MRKKRPRTRPSTEGQPQGQQPERARALTRRLLGSEWAPVLFFALLSAVYFSDFVLSNRVVLGVDTGTEFHQGTEPFWDKVKDLSPENWSRYLGGTPMSGARQAKYFPLHVVYLFTSHHRYLGWRYLFAMFTAGYFMYLCTRGFGPGKLAGLFAGTAYASAPAFLTFTYAGHDAKMLVVGLFPLMVWGLYRGMETRRPIYFLLMGVGIGAGIYTPHLQLVYYAAWGLGLIFICRLLTLYLRERSIPASVRRSLLAAGGICLGLGIGAMGSFPQYFYTKTESRRAGDAGEGLGIAYAQSWSLHPEEIASLLVPEFANFDNHQQRRYWGRNAFKLNSEYFGIAVLLLAAFSLRNLRRNDTIPPLLLLSLFALAFSVGPHTPLHALVYRLVPGMQVLRAPGMIAFLFVFPACALAGLGVHELTAWSEASSRSLRRFGVVVLLLAGLLVAAALAPSTVLDTWLRIAWTDAPAEKLQLARANAPALARVATLSACLAAGLILLAWRRLAGKMPPATFVLLVIAVGLIDTWRIDKQFLRYADPARYPAPEKAVPRIAGLFRRDTELYRALVLPQVKFQDLDLVTISGHEPFTVRRYDEITKLENRNNLAILNLLNTKYILSQEQLNLPYATEVLDERGLRVIRNDRALPWFYLAPACVVETEEDRILERLRSPAFDPTATAIVERDIPGLTGTKGTAIDSTGSLQRLAYDPRSGHIQIKVRSATPGLLVVSENYHPNWHAFVDGQERPVFRANYVWKGVPVPAGDHLVELRYRDPVASLCRWITLLSTLAALVFGTVFVRQGRIHPARDRLAPA